MISLEWIVVNRTTVHHELNTTERRNKSRPYAVNRTTVNNELNTTEKRNKSRPYAVNRTTLNNELNTTERRNKAHFIQILTVCKIKLILQKHNI